MIARSSLCHMDPKQCYWRKHNHVQKSVAKALHYNDYEILSMGLRNHMRCFVWTVEWLSRGEGLGRFPDHVSTSTSGKDASTSYM